MLIPTNIPGLFADIIIKESGDKVRVIATGTNADGIPIENLPKGTSQLVSSKRRQTAVNEARAKVERYYRKLYAEAPLTEADLRKALDIIKTECETGTRKLQPRWKDVATNTGPLVYFVSNTFDLVKPYILDPNRILLESNRLSILEEIIQITLPRVKNVQSKAQEVAQKRLREVDIIYAHLRELLPGLPVIRFAPADPVPPKPKPEQLKTLPRSVLMMFYRRLRKLVASAPKLVFFAVMVIFGMRPAEAAARKPCEIVWHDSFCTIFVNSQVKRGKIVPQLKNNYSRRVVIIPYWGRYILQCCCDVIKNNYPITDDVPMHLPTDCARWVKQLLIDCGLTIDDISEMSDIVTSDDLDDDEDEDTPQDVLKQYKIVCYILRRVYATICRSIMGLSLYVTDRQMVHVPIGAGDARESKITNEDLNSYSVQKSIAEKMERYVYDPEISLNPGCTSYKCSDLISLKKAKDDLDTPVSYRTLIPYSLYEISNNTDTPMTVDLNLTGAERGEMIQIIAPSRVDHLGSNSQPLNWLGKSRDVIGDTRPPKLYKEDNY